MVARIAPEPINANVDVSGYRSRTTELAVSRQQVSLLDDPLPPVLTPVPIPVPAPAIQTPMQSFAAALIASEMPVRPVTPAEFRVRADSGWRAPESSLRLTDRRV